MIGEKGQIEMASATFPYTYRGYQIVEIAQEVYEILAGNGEKTSYASETVTGAQAIIDRIIAINGLETEIDKQIVDRYAAIEKLEAKISKLDAANAAESIADN